MPRAMQAVLLGAKDRAMLTALTNHAGVSLPIARGAMQTAYATDLICENYSGSLPSFRSHMTSDWCRLEIAVSLDWSRFWSLCKYVHTQYTSLQRSTPGGRQSACSGDPIARFEGSPSSKQLQPSANKTRININEV